MSRLKPAVFYTAEVQWTRCNSKEWMEALPKDKPVETEGKTPPAVPPPTGSADAASPG
jgi:hypothetical protein